MENSQTELIEDTELLIERLQQALSLVHHGTPDQVDAALESIPRQIKLHAQGLGITGEILDAAKQRLTASGWRSVLVPVDFEGAWHVCRVN